MTYFFTFVTLDNALNVSKLSVNNLDFTSNYYFAINGYFQAIFKWLYSASAEISSIEVIVFGSIRKYHITTPTNLLVSAYISSTIDNHHLLLCDFGYDIKLIYYKMRHLIEHIYLF